MKQQHYQLEAFMDAKNLNREPEVRRQKQPWQTPELQEADYEITADGPVAGGDRFGLGIS
jgi:hypothetical protein